MKKDWYVTFKEKGVTYMQCKHCDEYVSVSEDAVAVTCSRCVTIIQLNKYPNSLPKNWKQKSSGRPAGWHFMNEFVDKDGTLPPTKVKLPKKRKRLSADEKLLKQAEQYKRKQKLKRAFKKQKDFLDGKVNL